MERRTWIFRKGGGGWGFTRSHLLKSKKVIIIQSDFRTLVARCRKIFVSQMEGGGSTVEKF